MIGGSLNRTVFLAVLLVAGLILLVVLGIALYEVRRENTALKKALDLVEESFEEEREIIQGQVDSLQGKIEEQEEVNGYLRGLFRELEDTRELINTEADEKAHDIHRIDDVDNLRDEIARHYRP